MKQNDIYEEWKELEIIILNNFFVPTHMYMCVNMNV